MANNRLSQIASHLTMESKQSVFSNVPMASPDPVFHLSACYNEDPNPEKINLGIGAYRDNDGNPWILPSVKKAETIMLNDPNNNHEYLPIAGIPAFTSAAANIILSKDSPVITQKRITSIQSVSGTGSLRLAGEFLKRFYSMGTEKLVLYVSDPTWGNHHGIFNDCGFDVRTYRYYNYSNLSLDFQGLAEDLNNAPKGSIIILHSCAHNPTGVDPTQEQWKQLAELFKRKGLYPFFDTAYQGFASGCFDRDSWSIRHFFNEVGFEGCIAQSFAKNMGLYGERIGCLHFVVSSPSVAALVKSQVSIIQRVMISNPPGHGAKIATLLMTQPELYEQWRQEVRLMANRIISMRVQLKAELLRLGTPGNWDHITSSIGMFSFTGLNERQVAVLQKQFHIYMLKNGRISMAGLNSKNILPFAKAVDYVVRNVV